jgi:glutamyl endopeptidase
MFDQNNKLSSPANKGARHYLATYRSILLIVVFLFGTSVAALAQEPNRPLRNESPLSVTSDNRYRVDTSKFPFSAIVRLKVTVPDGATGWGGGALIGPDKIITAEHVVYDPARGGHASVVVQPGYDNGKTICATTIVTSIKHGAHQGCHDGAKCDVAIHTTKDNVGCNTGWFGFKEYGGANVRDVYIAGYPSDLSGGERLYFVRTDAQRSNDSRHNILEYTEWTATGMSGGPIFTSDFYIVGIHTNAGTRANYGVGLCNQLAGSVRKWKYE